MACSFSGMRFRELCNSKRRKQLNHRSGHEPQSKPTPVVLTHFILSQWYSWETSFIEVIPVPRESSCSSHCNWLQSYLLLSLFRKVLVEEARDSSAATIQLQNWPFLSSVTGRHWEETDRSSVLCWRRHISASDICHASSDLSLVSHKEETDTVSKYVW